MPVADPERRAALNAAKLQSLVAGRFARVEPTSGGGFGRGAAMVCGARAFVLVEERPTRAVGPALAWAAQKGATEVHLLVDDESVARDLARRAALFTTAARVWHIDGRELVESGAGPAPEHVAVPASALGLASMLTAGGAEVNIEHGVVTGEVLGLEVARVTEGPDQSRPRLEVGVGRHDREAFAIVHGDVPTEESLRSVIEAVRRQRRPGADAHPLNQLSLERWLLVTLLAGGNPAEIDSVGRDSVEPESGWLGILDGYRLGRCAATVMRESVKDVVPAVAAGHDATGAPVVVAVSTGIDPDAVPVAADTRSWIDPEAKLILVVPERDDHPVTRRLTEALRVPAEIVTVPDTWREGALA